jgi:cobalt-precorrin-5B (C1)-methyltransferase
VLELTRASGIDLAPMIAEHARRSAIETLRGAAVNVEIIVTDRQGDILARSA